MSEQDNKHRNDIYGDAPERREGANEAIPAATVVLLRENPELEVLMLHKTSQIAFGGMWVFPGGRIDPEDYPPDGDVNAAARAAAVRETLEEAGIAAREDAFVWFAHWTPPPGTPKRFTTWFFAAAADSHDVIIDGGEIQDHQWLRPADALAKHAASEIDLAPPTWVTLFELARAQTVEAALARFRARPPRVYETRIGKRADGVRVAMWKEDAGYASADAMREGGRHRLNMAPGGFAFEYDAVDY
jgi:8-oxo-dGTP pyrophosphatase MutT (NUDIX family)